MGSFAALVALIGLGAICSLLLLHRHLPSAHLPSAAERSPRSFGFVELEGSRIAGRATSGLAVASINGSHDRGSWLAVANFYGESELHALNPGAPSLGPPRRVQSFATKAAHDFEVLTTPNGRTQLVAAEYDATRSLVYEPSDATAAATAALAGWPECNDSDHAACASWSQSGECNRNPGFMHASCPMACGRCAALHGPLVAVQSLPGLGGTAARHVRIGGAKASPMGRPRDLLLVANYKAPPGQSVSVFEWRSPTGTGGAVEERSSAGSVSAPSWHWVEYLDAPGAGEATACAVPQTGEELLIIPSWNANGSFATTTHVFAYVAAHAAAAGDTEGASRRVAPMFERRQALPTHGSHDAECFVTVAKEGGAPLETTVLLVANGRHDSGRRDIPCVAYVYDVKARAFVEVQRLPTVGAHDIEVVRNTPAGTLAVVANGASWSRATARADGGESEGVESCNTTTVDVYRWDGGARRLNLLQQLDAGGCTTFARAWRARGRILLAVAVERLRSGSFDGGVRLFELRARGNGDDEEAVRGSAGVGTLRSAGSKAERRATLEMLATAV